MFFTLVPTKMVVTSSGRIPLSGQISSSNFFKEDSLGGFVMSYLFEKGTTYRSSSQLDVNNSVARFLYFSMIGRYGQYSNDLQENTVERDKRVGYRQRSTKEQTYL